MPSFHARLFSLAALLRKVNPVGEIREAFNATPKCVRIRTRKIIPLGIVIEQKPNNVFFSKDANRRW